MNRIRIMDYLSGKNVWGYYKEYQKTQWFTDIEMRQHQLKKLQLLLTHCYYNVPYYKRIIDNRRININNIQSLDILYDFPILTKELIQTNYKDFIPNNNSKIRGVKTKQTGGTTGNILFNRNDSNTRSSTWASYKRYEDWMGIKDYEKTLILMGGHVKKSTIINKIKSVSINILNNSYPVDIYNTSEETIEKVISMLQKYGFSQIRSYPQFLFSVAKIIQTRGLNFSVRAISTTAEPVMPQHRELFRNVFNSEVFDQFGCGEIGGIAYECERHEGLHVTEERVILEINDINELIITDLDNYTMPFIRFWNADQAIISDKKCSCGRQSALLKRIMGRTCDYIIGINGEFLHWAYFWHLIFDSNLADKRNIRKFQVVQETKDLLIIRFVADAFTDEEKHFLIDDIKKRTGPMQILFKYEYEIENTKTGKYRPVINKVI